MSTEVPDELAIFDRGVFELSDSRDVVGHVATLVERVWSPFRRHHQVWLLITWADGRRERVFEDYQPWTAVSELRSGALSWEGLELAVRQLDADERTTAWDLYGITDAIGAYL
ncbi:MAG TPA: hypothetical protein VHO29_16595 [Marmoricola sp.]|nr:hypothetical protein [Marmoricola sp.]